MKPVTTFAIACGALLAAGLLSVIPARSQNANVPVALPVIEQYRILSGRLPKTGEFKTDAQMQLELNALGAEGWKVRAANENAIILAR
jgi:hypothetical protein